MRAAVIGRYGPPEVVTMADRPDPEVGAGGLLVRVRATAVTAADARIRGARFPAGFAPFARLAFGVSRPRRAVLGGCFSGVVEAIGAGVTGFGVGDAVAGMTGATMGAHAELLVVPASRGVATKPAAVSHADAAGVVFGGATALHFLRDRARLTAGSSVLVVGASGAIGTNAVQLARHLGGTLTAVTSTANFELARELGAERMIDYAETDIAAIPDRFDVVFDTVGVLSPRRGRRLLAPDGVLLLAAADLWQTLHARGNVKAGVSSERAEDFAYLLGLVAAGDLRVVHDPTTWADLDADLGRRFVAAHRRVDSGRKVGNIVLTL